MMTAVETVKSLTVNFDWPARMDHVLEPKLSWFSLSGECCREVSFLFLSVTGVDNCLSLSLTAHYDPSFKLHMQVG